MLFRNLTLYRLHPAFAESFAERKRLDFDNQILSQALTPLGPQELARAGFVAPWADAPSEFAVHGGDMVFVTMAKLERLLPAAVVNTEVARQVAAIEAERGRAVRGRERKRIREDVLFSMMPQAFVRERRTSGYIDTRRGWLVIDTATRSTAEAFLTLLRQALESVPAAPADPQESPRAIMTGWVANGLGDTPAEDRIELGDTILMKDPADGGATVRCSAEDLQGDEVREHIKSGKHVRRLGLLWSGQMSFVLGDDLVIRNLRWLDIETDEESEGGAPAFSAQLQMMGGQIGRLIDDLDAIFKLTN